MKRIRKKSSLIYGVLLLCAALLLAACGGDPVQQTDGSDANGAEYRVTVQNALGNPYTSGVIVRFLQNGEQAAMQVVDDNGVAAKNLDAGDYTVELMFTDDAASYYYDKSDLTLSADKTELQITLSYALTGDPVILYAQGEECAAYNVNLGSTYVNLTAGERNYFLFTPTVAGTYEFSVVGDGEAIGYYGIPQFVQNQNVGDVTDKGVSTSVRTDMINLDGNGTNVLVLGIDAGTAENCILAIERIGEPEHSLVDEPWTVYKTTAQLAPYTVEPGANLVDFDLTASSDTYNLVYNEADGFYHLDSADGPLVLVRLAKESKYLEPFQAMLENGNICKYFFDAEGNFVKKEIYNECLSEYLQYVDEDNGVYPMTEDLKYIIQQRGDYVGWWNPDMEGSMFLFVDNAWNPLPNINLDIAWLFMCCYATES